jgi:capsid protein
MSFKEFQRQHSAKLHRPVMRWKIRRWLRQDKGLLRAFETLGEDLFKHSWQFPGWPYIEPLKDVQADAAEIAANLNSPRRVAARRKLDYDVIISETCADRAALIECALDKAAELNAHPYIVANEDEKVTWREISHPVMPDGLQMQILDKNAQSSDERADDSQAQETPSG